MRRIILAAAIFFELSANAFSTAIFATWYPDFIFVGADSWEVRSDGPPVVTCKTRVFKNVVVAIAGLMGGRTVDNYNFRFDDVTGKELTKAGIMGGLIVNAENTISDMIKEQSDFISSDLPNEQIKERASLSSEIVFAYSQDGKMRLEYFDIAFDENRNKFVTRTIRCPEQCNVGVIFPLGAREEIKQVIRSNPEFLDSNPMSLGIRSIIQEVSRLVPDVVGGPISIIKLTPMAGMSGLIKASVTIRIKAINLI
jgi:hypothetical protein